MASLLSSKYEARNRNIQNLHGRPYNPNPLDDGVNSALGSPLLKEERSLLARTQRKLFLDRIDAQTGPILEWCG